MIITIKTVIFNRTYIELFAIYHPWAYISFFSKIRILEGELRLFYAYPNPGNMEISAKSSRKDSRKNIYRIQPVSL